MRRRSDNLENWEELRNRIIGMGEQSSRKSYYPELKARLHELEQTKKSLADVNTFLQAVMDAATEAAIIATTPDGTITLFNRGAERLFGYRAEEVIGRLTPLSFHLDAELDRHGKELNAAYGISADGFRGLVERADREGSEKLEWTCLHKDGSHIPIEVVVTPIREKGETTGYLGIATDISQRKQAEERLRLSEQKYASIFHLMPDMVGITRMEDGVFIEVNKGFEQWTGWKKEELVGRSSLDIGLWSPEARARAVAITREQGRLVNYEFVLGTRSGEKRSAVMYLTPITIQGEECLYFMVRDITESMLAEAEILQLNETLEQRVHERTAQLEAANKALAEEVEHRQQMQDKVERLNRDLQERSESLELVNRELESFSYSVSHDLRAPLRHMAGFSRILLEDYGEKLDADAVGYLLRIEQAGDKMGLLIDSLLQLSRISRTELTLQRVDLSSLAREVVAELREQSPDRLVEVEIDDGLSVMADPVLARVALQNLLGNAWKYTRGVTPAVIGFFAEVKDGKRYFCVRDNGAGFDMSYAGKLFGAFQRLHSDQEFEGTGIGLATVQRIIHRHGGEIRAEAESGNGATFKFTLG